MDFIPTKHIGYKSDIFLIPPPRMPSAAVMDANWHSILQLVCLARQFSAFPFDHGMTTLAKSLPPIFPQQCCACLPSIISRPFRLLHGPIPSPVPVISTVKCIAHLPVFCCRRCRKSADWPSERKMREEGRGRGFALVLLGFLQFDGAVGRGNAGRAGVR